MELEENIQMPQQMNGKPLDGTSGLYLALALLSVGMAVTGIGRGWEAIALLGVFVLAGFAFLTGSTWGCECSETEYVSPENADDRPADL
jgi:hypothetical protein